MIIGIDIGSTITKAVSLEGGAVTRKVKTRAEDALTSAAGAFGKMLVENGIQLASIEKIRITGAGASKIQGSLFGVKTENVDEITAIGLGGLHLAQKEKGAGKDAPLIIANVGTGTILIEANGEKIEHVGGSGVGGGTILGLCKRLISLSAFSDIMEAAETGDLSQVDLLLGDIMGINLSFLSRDSTAANFGKMLDTAKQADIALAVINLVFQVIGMLSVFAAKGRGIESVLVTGSGSENKFGKKILDVIGAMYNIKFFHPNDAQYTTAIGAALYS